MTARSVRTRLDEAVVAQGLAETRSQARAYILAGDITVNDEVVRRAGHAVHVADRLGRAEKPRFVSRGGDKLAHALGDFALDVSGLVVADLGASTGGFTDAVLQGGAIRVYAVDVGYGQLHDRLRRDQRVIVMDRTNARAVESLPELVDLVVIDVSFISLKLVLPAALRLLKPGGIVVPLIKPQFEAGPKDVRKGGVVRDPEVHGRVLHEVLTAAQELGFGVRGLTASPLLGPAGNREFLALLTAGAESLALPDLVPAALAMGPQQ